MSEAMELGAWAERHLLSLQAEHIAGSTNLQADWPNRTDIDPAEGQLHLDLFHQIVLHFGQPKMDLFATLNNTQVPRFLSRYWSPMAEGINTLRCKWPQGFLYAFPPIPLIPRVIQKILEERAESSSLPHIGLAGPG